MYRDTNNNQSDIYVFILPFSGHLKEYNRWVVLSGMIDWDMINEDYSQNFRNKKTDQEAYSQIVFGSLYIQQQLAFTDRELVEQIDENPYMQFFIGYKEYRNEKPFDQNLLVTFRKCFPEKTLNQISKIMFIQKAYPDDKDGDKGSSDGMMTPETIAQVVTALMTSVKKHLNRQTIGH